MHLNLSSAKESYKDQVQQNTWMNKSLKIEAIKKYR